MKAISDRFPKADAINGEKATPKIRPMKKASTIGFFLLLLIAIVANALAGHEQDTITGELRLYQYADAKIQIEVTSGAGRVIASGQSANNSSNDPAAHVAVQGQ
jgi:hypothetical protein